jgi:hypothetical protein
VSRKNDGRQSQGQQRDRRWLRGTFHQHELPEVIHPGPRRVVATEGQATQPGETGFDELHFRVIKAGNHQIFRVVERGVESDADLDLAEHLESDVRGDRKHLDVAHWRERIKHTLSLGEGADAC